MYTLHLQNLPLAMPSMHTPWGILSLHTADATTTTTTAACTVLLKCCSAKHTAAVSWTKHCKLTISWAAISSISVSLEAITIKVRDTVSGIAGQRRTIVVTCNIRYTHTQRRHDQIQLAIEAKHILYTGRSWVIVNWRSNSQHTKTNKNSTSLLSPTITTVPVFTILQCCHKWRTMYKLVSFPHLTDSTVYVYSIFNSQ